MDVLSDTLSMLKPRSYITAGFDAGGAWSLLLDDLAGRIKCYVVLRGSCWLRVENGGVQIRIEEGDCFILPSGSPVRIGSDMHLVPQPASLVLAPDRDGETVIHNGGGEVLLAGARFEIAGARADMLLGALPQIIHLRAAADRTALRWSIDLMMHELREARPGAKLIAQQLAHIMLVQALRIFAAEHAATAPGWFSAFADPRIAAALAAIHSHPGRNWTVAELGARAGMSRSAFARRFREKMDETPIIYLSRWRMAIAAEQLIEGHKTISQIALALGYDSENAFSWAFRRIMGTSPRRFGRALSTS